MTKRIDWTWEETVLAAWAAARNEWRGVNMRTPVVQELSDVLRALSIHPTEDRPENFRSPGSAGRKINSIRAARPDYVGIGLRVTAMEAEVADRFLADQEGMMAAAQVILDRHGVPTRG